MLRGPELRGAEIPALAGRCLRLYPHPGQNPGRPGSHQNFMKALTSSPSKGCRRRPPGRCPAVAGGIVVHASANPAHSNYGRYVVIEHWLKDGPLYSLYAHLASVNCREGTR